MTEVSDSRIACPQCQELNPKEAVMCWACYAPLTPYGINPNHSGRGHHWQEYNHFSPPFEEIGIYGSICGLFLSGWLPAKYRVPVLLWSLGIGGLIALSRGSKSFREFKSAERSRERYFELPPSGAWQLDSFDPLNLSH